jgi:chaperonin GroES
MPPIDDLDLMLDDPAAAMGMARDYLSLEEPEELALDEMEPQEDDPRAVYEQLIANIQSTNIAADLDDTELNAIGQKVLREYEIDLQSRSEWEDKSRKAMDLAMQIAKEKVHPWPNASNVVYPLMTMAAVNFNARAYPAIIQGRSVVKGVVVGKDDGTPMPPEMVQQLMMGMGGRPGGVAGPMPGIGAPGMDPGMPMQIPSPRMGHNGGPQMEQEQGQPPQQQQVWIVPPGAKTERATRIGEHMSWQLLEEMPEWQDETDKLLLILPIVGCAFRKSFFDHALGHNSSLLVLAQNLVINYHAKSVESAPRITEQIQFYPYEIKEQVRAGLWIDHDYGANNNNNGDDDAPHDFLEQHRWLDLDEDDFPEPYIVTVHKPTGKVARIVARYDAEGVMLNQEGNVAKIRPVHYYTKFDFIPNPDGGIYGVGFGQLLTPINEATNTTLNQLFDAGSLANTGGGFIGRGVSMHAGSLKFRLGEWKQLNVPGSTVKDAIVPFNHPGPSPVLIQLLGLLIEAGKDLSGNKDALSGDMAAATMQPTTLMAAIEQGLKGFIAVFKRVHTSLKAEFDKLYRLNSIYLQQQAQYEVGGEWRTVTKDDYVRGSGVELVSDPNMVSDMQRMAQAQLLQGYQTDPFCNPINIRKRIFTTAQIEKIDELLVEQLPPNPEILAKTAELEARNRELDLREREIVSKEASAKTGQMKDMSQVVLNLAQADKANGDMDLAWTIQYVEVMRAQMEQAQRELTQPANRAQQGAQQPQLQPPAGPVPPEYQFAPPGVLQ